MKSDGSQRCNRPLLHAWLSSVTTSTSFCIWFSGVSTSLCVRLSSVTTSLHISVTRTTLASVVSKPRTTPGSVVHGVCITTSHHAWVRRPRGRSSVQWLRDVAEEAIAHVDKLLEAVRILIRKLFSDEYIISHSVKAQLQGTTNKMVTEKVHVVQK